MRQCTLLTSPVSNAHLYCFTMWYLLQPLNDKIGTPSHTTVAVTYSNKCCPIDWQRAWRCEEDVELTLSMEERRCITHIGEQAGHGGSEQKVGSPIASHSPVRCETNRRDG